MELPFVKMQGTGNSFVIVQSKDVNDILSTEDSAKKFAKKMCSVNFGVGADGLVLIADKEKEIFPVTIFNADGSNPEMCGNAIRCLAKYVVAEKLLANYESERPICFKITHSTKGTVKETYVRPDSLKDKEALVTVNMGAPAFISESFAGEALRPVKIAGREYYFVSMDNPHAVSFVKDFNFDYQAAGRVVENNKRYFPDGVNVEYIALPNRHNDEKNLVMNMRVWERGVGETLSCGSGACAATVAALSLLASHPFFLNKVPIHDNNTATINLLGGELMIEWCDKKNVLLTGNCEVLVKGVFLV